MNFRNIFSINSDDAFQTAALDIFRYQATTCEPYRRYINYLGILPEKVDKIEQIPFLPIELFKSERIICGEPNYDIVFSSSGTTGTQQSHHYIKDVSVYETSFVKGFELFYGKPEQLNIFALLPSYLEREGSSLIYMVEHLIAGSPDSGFFLYDHENLLKRLECRDVTKKTILFGVSFALLDLAEQQPIKLGESVTVMETGGMKGRRKELPREELQRILCRNLGVSAIHSEYGMCECLSQAYSDGNGTFRSVPWMRILVRDLHDPFHYLGNNRRGGLNIIDLANFNSCSFIQTQDLGMTYSDGQFSVEGRIDYSDIRGCNLLI